MVLRVYFTLLAELTSPVDAFYAFWRQAFSYFTGFVTHPFKHRCGQPMSEVANKRTDDGLTRLKTHLTSPLGTFTHFADKPLRILRFLSAPPQKILMGSADEKGGE